MNIKDTFPVRWDSAVYDLLISPDIANEKIRLLRKQAQRNIRVKEYREAHKDEIKKYRKEYQSTLEQKEKRRIYNKKYNEREDVRDKRREYMREYMRRYVPGQGAH
jgi:hypothetical protein